MKNQEELNERELLKELGENSIDYLIHRITEYEFFINSVQSKEYNSQDFYLTKLSMASNEFTPYEVQEVLSLSQDIFIIKELLNNSNLSAESLNNIKENSDDFIKESLIFHPNMTPEMIQSVYFSMNEPSKELNKALAQREDLSSDIIEDIAFNNPNLIPYFNPSLIEYKGKSEDNKEIFTLKSDNHRFFKIYFDDIVQEKQKVLPYKKEEIENENKFDLYDNAEKIILPFGKYQGKNITEIPVDYLKWMVKNIDREKKFFSSDDFEIMECILIDNGIEYNHNTKHFVDIAKEVIDKTEELFKQQNEKIEVFMKKTV